MSIGRAATCDIVVDAPGVSRLHALIVVRDGAYTLRDQGSMNGIYVAGQRVNEALLREGELVRIPDPYGNVWSH
jgi:pSer/pThr/pTyr-binding forkhead associated (FHA) protein